MCAHFRETLGTLPKEYTANTRLNASTFFTESSQLHTEAKIRDLLKNKLQAIQLEDELKDLVDVFTA